MFAVAGLRRRGGAVKVPAKLRERGPRRKAETGENSTEIQAHSATYGGFTKLMLWGTIASFAVGVFVVFMIAS